MVNPIVLALFFVLAILLAAGIAAGAMAGGYFMGMRAARLGLKWQVQVEKGEQPTDDPKKPKPEKKPPDVNRIVNEWLNGENGDGK